MSWWKSRRSLDASTGAISKASSSRSLRNIHSHANYSMPASPSPGANWNNGSSLSLPTYAEAVEARLDPAESPARRQKLATFLQELQYDEELRLTEARRPSGLSSGTPILQSDNGSQISEKADSIISLHENILKVAPAPSSLDRRRTLTSIEEVSDLFPEPDMLGPKTSNLYNRRPTSAPLRKRSFKKDYAEHSPSSFCVELDGLPISNVIELPTNNSNNYPHANFEYGNKRFNTLPGEPFPLTERRKSSHSAQTIPELATTEDETEHQAFQAFLQPDFDPRTGLEIMPTSSHRSHFPSEEDIVSNSIHT